MLLIGGCGGGGGNGSTPAPVPPTGNDPPGIALEAAFSNLAFTQPLLMLQPTADSSIWFVVERGGVIRAFDNDPAVSTSRVFADLSAIVDSAPNEGGLLGMAFHPDYANNRRVYLSFTVTGAPLVSRIEQVTLSLIHL